MSGVIGIYSKDRNDASLLTYYGLYALQHRGQVSSGIAINNNGFIDYFKDLGLAHEVFPKSVMDRFKGNIAVGHVRYARNNSTQITNAQPLVVGYKQGALALVHDGAVVNFQKLKDELEDNGAIFQSEIDSEVIANLIARYHKDDIEKAIVSTLKDIVGSYGLIIMNKDMLIGARDPQGIKPLSLGKLGDGTYLLSSETCAFDTIGAEFLRDLAPGEIVFIDERGVKSVLLESKPRKLCFFETIYFARPDSLLDGTSIYLSRIEAGRQLAIEHPAQGDIVIGAPDSGTVSAIGYAEQSKIPYAEGIVKNRYVGRTFIQPTQELRELGVRLKLNPLKENIENKRIILVDDSIIRGTTIKRTVKMLMDAGAKEVHVRIAAPPVMYPCHLWMDTTARKNLIAAEMTIDEIEKMSGADSLKYLSIEGLKKSVDNGESFCTGCVNNIYPIPKNA